MHKMAATCYTHPMFIPNIIASHLALTPNWRIIALIDFVIITVVTHMTLEYNAQ